jgi:L-ribulose-5-phosphate 3-epimerase
MSNLCRRDFLSVATALAAGAILAPSLRAQPAEAKSPAAKPKRTLRKAVMFGMLQAADGASLTDKFKILRDAGFDGVEMDSPSSIPTDEILAATDKTGLKVHGLVDSVHWKYYLNSPEPDIRAKALDALRTALTDGKKLGAISVLLVPGVVNKDLSYDDCWSLTQQEIRKVLPVVKDTGVKIAIENVWNNFIMSPLEAQRYVDELGGPAAGVGWHFDIGNIINFGYPDQWINILGPRILKLHIKDFSRAKRDKEGLWKGFEVELGDGDAGWPAVMAALDRTGYSTAPTGNWATAEVRGGPPARLKEISAQMDKLFAL